MAEETPLASAHEDCEKQFKQLCRLASVSQESWLLSKPSLVMDLVDEYSRYRTWALDCLLDSPRHYESLEYQVGMAGVYKRTVLATIHALKGHLGRALYCFDLGSGTLPIPMHHPGDGSQRSSSPAGSICLSDISSGDESFEIAPRKEDVSNDDPAPFPTQRMGECITSIRLTVTALYQLKLDTQPLIDDRLIVDTSSEEFRSYWRHDVMYLRQVFEGINETLATRFGSIMARRRMVAARRRRQDALTSGRPSRLQVFDNLKPYACTLPECKSATRPFISPSAWWDHEQAHRSKLFCGDKTHRVHDDTHSFKDHMKKDHAMHFKQTDELLDVFRIPSTDPQKCHLCGSTEAPSVIEDHVAAHLEHLALLAFSVRDLRNSTRARHLQRSLLGRRKQNRDGLYPPKTEVSETWSKKPVATLGPSPNLDYHEGRKWGLLTPLDTAVKSEPIALHGRTRMRRDEVDPKVVRFATEQKATSSQAFPIWTQETGEPAVSPGITSKSMSRQPPESNPGYLLGAGKESRHDVSQLSSKPKYETPPSTLGSVGPPWKRVLDMDIAQRPADFQPSPSNPLAKASGSAYKPEFLPALNSPFIETGPLTETQKEDEKSTYHPAPIQSFVIGKTSDCDLIISSSYVSSRHCVLYTEEASSRTHAVIYDLSSRGTFVNGQLIGKGHFRVLEDGNIITIADVGRFLFKYPVKLRNDGFLERYLVREEVRQIDYARVHRCREKATNKIFHVKILARTLVGSAPIKSENLQNEVGLLMSIDSPRIVRLITSYDEPFAHYLVQEEAPGGSLLDHIKNSGPLKEETAKALVVDLLAAVEYLHHRGIVHRDIKPEGIVLTDYEIKTVKLADLSLATLERSSRPLSDLCGTPDYMAPEVIGTDNNEERKYGRPVDIWSLGVVLYICLCGFPPFSASKYSDDFPYSLSDQITQARFSFPSPYWDGISAEARSMVTSMLVVDPDKRPLARHCVRHPWLAPFNASSLLQPRDFERQRHRSRSNNSSAPSISPRDSFKGGEEQGVIWMPPKEKDPSATTPLDSGDISAPSSPQLGDLW